MSYLVIRHIDEDTTEVMVSDQPIWTDEDWEYQAECEEYDEELEALAIQCGCK